MQITPPYLMFLGDVPDQLAAKTAQGIVDWRPEWCVGQIRLPGCKADLRLPDLTIADAAAQGVKTLIVGVANAGGVLPDHWTDVIVAALNAGLDVASGLHTKLGSKPAIAEAAARNKSRKPRPSPLPSLITPAEAAAHAAFIGEMGDKAVWKRLLAPPEAAE